GGVGLRPGKDGEFVRYSDYAELEAENARLEGRNLEHEMRLEAEEAKSEYWRSEALSRTGAVKVKALEWIEYKSWGNSVKTLAHDCFGNEFRRFDLRLDEIPPV